MSQQPVNPSWGQRPSSKKAAAGDPDAAELDKFVSGGKVETVRLNVEIPRTLRVRVKSRCALEERDIKDVIIEFLEQRFPE